MENVIGERSTERSFHNRGLLPRLHFLRSLAFTPASCSPASCAVTLCLLLGLLLPLHAVFALPPSTPQSIILSGSLVDSNGAPVAGATVFARSTESPYEEARFFLTGQHRDAVARTRTTTDGGFSLSVPDRGFWTLTFSHANYGPARVLPYSTFFGSTHFAPVEMTANRAVSVFVTNSSAQAIPKATVQILSSNYPGAFGKANRSNRVRAQQFTAQTNSAGQATLDAVRSRATIVVQAPGFLPSKSSVTEDATVAEVELEKAVLLPHTVLTSDGEPADGAVVFVNGIATAIANAQGQVDIPAPRGGTHTVKVLHGSMESLELTLVGSLSSPTKSERRITLKVPAKIKGIVTDEKTGKGIASAWAWEFRSDPVMANSKGEYELLTPAILVDTLHRGQARTSHYLAASAPGYFGLQERITDPVFDSRNGAPLRLEAHGTIHGRVVDARNRPLANAALVSVALDGRGGFSLQRLSAADPAFISNADGSFTLEPIAGALQTRIETRLKGYANNAITVDPSDPSKATSTTAEVVVRLLRGTLVTGLVVDESDVPIPGATVTIKKAPKGGQQLNQMVQAEITSSVETHTGTTNTAGTFEFVDFSSGHYDLRITAPTFAPVQVRAVEVPAFDASALDSSEEFALEQSPPPFELGTIAMGPGAVLEGTVKSSSGKALEGVLLVIKDEAGQMIFSGRRDPNAPTAISDSSGRFLFDSLVHQRQYGLEASLEGFAEGGLSAVVAPTSEAVVVVLEPAIDLSGRVVDESGTMIQRANVRGRFQASSPEEIAGLGANYRSSMRFASVDAKGDFLLENLRKGTWNLSASAQGYIALENQAIEIDPAKSRDKVTLRLKKGATLEGQITGPDGEPVPRATVGKRQASTPRRSRTLRGSKTDAEGHYVLEGLTLGSGSFEVGSDNYRAAIRDIEIQPGSNHLDIQLEPSLEISGFVFAANGDSAGGAAVSARLAGNRRIFIDTRDAALSRTDGSFTVKGLDPGTYTVTASKEGLPMATAREPQVLQTTSVAGIELHFQVGTTIRGTVTGLSFDKMSGMQVFAITADRSGTPLLGKPDYEGAFQLDNVTPGTWQIHASVDGTNSNKSKTVTIEEGASEVFVEFDFSEGFTLRGQVLINDLPTSGRTVIVSQGEFGRGGRAITDSAGNFSVADLQEGEYTVFTGHYQAPSASQDILLTGDQDIVLHIVEKALLVRVVDATSESPLVGISVTLTASEGSGLQFGFSDSRRVTDDAGHYSIEGIGVGTFRIVAQGKGYGVASKAITINEGSSARTEVELRLTTAASLVAYLKDSNGIALTAGYLAVLDPSGRPLITRPLQFGEEGRTLIQDVPAGTWTFLFADISSATVRRTIEISNEQDTGTPGATARLQMPASGHLQVTVPSLTTSQRQATLTIQDASGQPYLRADFPTLLNHPLLGGSTTLTNLPVGTYTLEISSSDGQDHWQATGQVVRNTTVIATVIAQAAEQVREE